MKRLIGLLILFGVSLVTYSSENNAFQKYFRGEYAESYPLLLHLAQNNNPQALYLLSNIKLYGYGAQKNIAKGLEYMHLAAENDNLNAQMYLGAYYLNDKKDLKLALYWLKKSANQGNASAQLFTALSYLNGFGTKKNIDLARHYFIKAAKNNIPMAQFELGRIFLKSRYAIDRKMGRLWLDKAANNHYSEPIEPVKHITSVTKAETSPLAAVKPWTKMMALLKKAKVVIANPTRRLADELEKTEMPIFKSISETQIIKPDYALITPNNLPISYIVIQVNKLGYENQQNILNSIGKNNLLPKPSKRYQDNLVSLAREVKFGHPQAMFEKAILYANGDGVAKNNEKAFGLFLKAAKQNYLKAEYVVGLYFMNGWVVEKNRPLAMAWLQKAALHGSAKAQLLLGNIYEYGLKAENPKKSIKKALSRAKAMYSLAAQNGIVAAKYRLAQMYASGLFNPTNNYSIQRDNLAMALKLYKQAANVGITQAEIYLSYFYASKNQPKEKQDYAFKIASKYSKSGNKNAKLLLAILYERGVGVRKSSYRASRIYQSLKNDNSVANFMLGTHYYLYGHHVVLAKKYLDKSSQEGNLFAKYNLAIIAKKNDDTDTNFLRLLNQSAKGSFDKANLLLADHYLTAQGESDSAKTAAHIYQQLAKKQNPVAELKLGYMYQKGIYYDKNAKNALYWYQRSAEHGNAIAQYQLGEIYQFGLGVRRELGLALNYYKKSAEQHFAPAMVAIGYIMQVDQFKYQDAEQWYEQAIELKSKQAKLNLKLLKKYD